MWSLLGGKVQGIREAAGTIYAGLERAMEEDREEEMRHAVAIDAVRMPPLPRVTRADRCLRHPAPSPTRQCCRTLRWSSSS